jgi:hypothetical protein
MRLGVAALAAVSMGANPNTPNQLPVSPPLTGSEAVMVQPAGAASNTVSQTPTVNISGFLPFLVGSGSSNTLAAPFAYFICTSTCTVTPPVPAAGYQFCITNDDNVSTVITIGNPGSSVRFENTVRTAYGTATTGTLTSGGAVGDSVCLVGRDSTHYLTVTSFGTWTAS